MRELQNLDHEKWLLGAMMIDNRIIESPEVNEDLFSSQYHRAICKAIRSLHSRGTNADLMTVADEVKAAMSRGNFEPWHTKHDITYIASLTSLPSVANKTHYLESLKAASILRKLADLGTSIGAMVTDPVLEPQNIVQSIEQSLTALVTQSGSGYDLVANRLVRTMEQIKAAHERKGKIPGVTTGFELLDTMTGGFMPQEVTIIGGRPGTGKTAIALEMIIAACNEGRRVGLFSAEMSTESIIKRMVSNIGFVNSYALRTGNITTSDMQSIFEAFNKLKAMGVYVNDTPNIPLVSLISEARKMRRAEGVEIIFVDYLGLVGNEEKNVPRHEQVAGISKMLKQLSRELDIPFVVLSQVTRETHGKRPTMADLRDSGAVEQDADQIMLLFSQGWLDDKKTKIKVKAIVEKNRNGATGDVDMVFTPAVYRYNQAEVVDD